MWQVKRSRESKYQTLCPPDIGIDDAIDIANQRYGPAGWHIIKKTNYIAYTNPKFRG